MPKERWRQSLELIGIAAVVASLIFVGLQVRQDRELMRADLAAQSFDNIAYLRLIQADPEFARTYAKMLEQPENLTVDEMIQVNSVLDAASYFISRECYLTDRNVFSECRGIVRGLARQYFGNRYAQSWWRINQAQRRNEDFELNPDWIDSIILGYDIESDINVLKRVLDDM